MTKPARLAAFLALSLACAAAPALADGGVSVTAPWARAAAPSARNGGAFMVVTNGGTEPDRIVAAQTPIAEKAELHTHQMDNGVMKMRPVDAIAVAPGEPVTLRPGGLHVMLLGLKQPLTQGSRFPVTLTFAKAPPVTVEVPVLGAAAMGPEGAAMTHEPMQHGAMDHNSPEHEAMHQQHMKQMQQQGQ
ncbi:copper chaperone PCu(A)C [Azospirillum rugosum]|uniref:Copper(I)-binding protein n=1 Tax=Azospirillum rugosum TaxID=416170 RepID=A0ABS4SLY3_9PROT|nr:copper chaperone PCu(A)C [Azospirillum rugosum]MBP2293561.1 copper(I)-binding protein [Azospirillum rugosum]MDQ0529240.1 copper(I)-binding protein [Azospirillum rugosum]